MRKIFLLSFLAIGSISAQTTTANKLKVNSEVTDNNSVDFQVRTTGTNLINKTTLAARSVPAYYQSAGVPSTNTALTSWMNTPAVSGRQLFYYDNDNMKLYTFDYGSSDWIMVSSSGGISEAPMNSQNYVRNNGSWVVAPTGGSSTITQVLSAGNTSTSGQSLTLTNGGNYQDPGNWSYSSITPASVIFKGLNSSAPNVLTNDYTLRDNNGVDFSAPFGGAFTKLTNSAFSSAPSPSSFGWKGEIRVSGGYLYLCIATNTTNSTGTWIRSAIETSW